MEATSLAVIVVILLIFVVFLYTRATICRQSFSDLHNDMKTNYRREIAARTNRLTRGASGAGANADADAEASPDELKTLAVMLTHGIPDAYDAGTFIEGIEPDHAGAIRLLTKAIKKEN